VSRLLLDTGVLVSAERSRSMLDDVIDDRDDVAISALTAAELLEGVERATPERRPARTAFVEAVLAAVPVEDYTVETARVHAQLLAHTRAGGVPRGAHDLMIAATALASQRQLVTTDTKAGFDPLPGLMVRFVTH